MQDAGKYVTVYRREGDGSWVMAQDIWNSDAPPPSSG
jgi:ketosteroid isomerase-like protein